MNTKIVTFLLIISVAFCSELNAKDRLIEIKSKVDFYLSKFEKKVIDFDTIVINNKLGIAPPFNLLAFFALGCVIKIFVSFFFDWTPKDTYVYNAQDNGEYLYKAINV